MGSISETTRTPDEMMSEYVAANPVVEWNADYNPDDDELLVATTDKDVVATPTMPVPEASGGRSFSTGQSLILAALVLLNLLVLAAVVLAATGQLSSLLN